MLFLVYPQQWYYLKSDRCVVGERCVRRYVTILRCHGNVGVRCCRWWFHHRHHGDVDIVPHHEWDGKSRERQYVEHHPCRHHVCKRELALWSTYHRFSNALFHFFSNNSNNIFLHETPTIFYRIVFFFFFNNLIVWRVLYLSIFAGCRVIVSYIWYDLRICVIDTIDIFIWEPRNQLSYRERKEGNKKKKITER